MRTILMIHTKAACMEYSLPQIKVGEYSILLEGKIYGMREALEIKLRREQNGWYFSDEISGILKKAGYEGLDFSLQHGDIWEIENKEKQVISILVIQIEKEFQSSQKYILPKQGRFCIGKALNNDICYQFAGLISGTHAALCISEQKIWIEDYSVNGVFCDGVRIEKKREVRLGEEITIFGLHLLFLADVLCVYGMGTLEINGNWIPWKGQISEKGERCHTEEKKVFWRSPRTLPVYKKEKLEIIVEKSRNPFFLRKKSSTKIPQKELEKLRSCYENARDILLRGYPSTRKCCEYDEKETRLWNRNWKQEDYGFIRIGLGNRTFEVEILTKGEEKNLDACREELKEFKTLKNVPVGISFQKEGLWGILGGEEKKGAYVLSYVILAQLMSSYSYHELKIGVITDKRAQWGNSFSFVKWVPHSWKEDGSRRYLAENREEVEELFEDWECNWKEETSEIHYILFVESISLLSREERKKYLEEGNDRLTTFLLAAGYDELPNCCEHILENTKEFQGKYHLREGEQKKERIIFDQVEEKNLEKFAKTIADIQVEKNNQRRKLPEKISFLEMYQAPLVSQLKLADRWRRGVAQKGLRVPVGIGEEGELCYLDADEKKDGPHGLLAGTTGSGKSEVLLTYILSLAVNFSPEEVAFVLVDFKGGGMSNFLERLPHVAGCITNLSGNEIERAMFALKSEIKRRQRLLAEAAVNHIRDYLYLRNHGHMGEGMPHLFFVVDEFAELKSQVPEFLEEIIHLAQVGRSLGLHLLLSTQKPKGTVNENILCNSRFRICLRVQTKEDSKEVIGIAKAASLTGSGMGYLAVGEDERLEKFLTAYAGYPYLPEQKKECAVLLRKNGGRELLITKHDMAGNKNKTELMAVLEEIDKEGRKQGFKAVKPLWLPALKEQLYLWELEESLSSSKLEGIRARIGMCDAPGEQKQIPYDMDFLKKGSYAIIGPVQSGKTTLVESMVAWCLKRYSPQMLHMYFLDFNSGRLSIFEAAEQAGALVRIGEVEALKRFLRVLEGIYKERKEQLVGRKYGKEEKNAMPVILVILDGMEGFREQTKEDYLEKIYSFIREGRSLGVFWILTAAGFGPHGIPSYYKDSVQEYVALGLRDKMEYKEIFFASNSFVMPEKKIGRGMGMINGKMLELQVALPGKTKEDVKERGTLLELIQKKWGIDEKNMPVKLPMLPQKIILEELEHEKKFISTIEESEHILIGYLEKDASPYWIEKRELNGFLISGKKKTGKENLMKTIGWMGKKKGMDCFVFVKNLSNMTEAGSWATGVMEQETEWFTCLSQIEEDKQKERMIFVEDIMDFQKRLERLSDEEMESFVTWIKEGEQRKMYWIFAMNPKDHIKLLGSEVFQWLIEKEHGIHLGGNLNEQKIFHFENITFKAGTESWSMGTGVVEDRACPQKGRKIKVIM